MSEEPDENGQQDKPKRDTISSRAIGANTNVDDKSFTNQRGNVGRSSSLKQKKKTKPKWT